MRFQCHFADSHFVSLSSARFAVLLACLDVTSFHQQRNSFEDGLRAVWTRFCSRNSSNAGQQNKRPFSRTPYAPGQLIRFRELKLD